MKSLYYKFLMFVLVAAMAAPFIMRDSDGRPLMSLEQLTMPEISTPELPELGSLAKGVERSMPLGGGEAPDKTRVYKWRDANGVWHFSDSAEATGAEAVELDPDANLVRHRPPPERDSAPTETAPDTADTPAAPSGPSLDRAPELVERARQVDDLLEDRHARQQRALDGL